MKMFLTCVLTLCIACLFSSPVGAQQPDTSGGASDEAQEPTPDYQTASFMRAKLVGSQQVLDGLVSEDFHLIRRGAESMKKMSAITMGTIMERRVMARC